MRKLGGTMGFMTDKRTDDNLPPASERGPGVMSLRRMTVRELHDLTAPGLAETWAEAIEDLEEVKDWTRLDEPTYQEKLHQHVAVHGPGFADDNELQRITVGPDKTVWDGNHRLCAAIELGQWDEEVLVDVVS